MLNIIFTFLGCLPQILFPPCLEIKRNPGKRIGTQRIIQGASVNCTLTEVVFSRALEYWSCCTRGLTLLNKEGWSLVLQMVLCAFWCVAGVFWCVFLPSHQNGMQAQFFCYICCPVLCTADCRLFARALKQQSLGMVSHPPRAEQMFALAVSRGTAGMIDFSFIC